jgi:hypothetical protein
MNPVIVEFEKVFWCDTIACRKGDVFTEKMPFASWLDARRWAKGISSLASCPYNVENLRIAQ